MNLEKQRGAQNTIKELIVDDKEIIDQTHILECYGNFMKLFFNNGIKKLWQKLKVFLMRLYIAKLSQDKIKLCEEDLTEKDLYDSLKSMQNNKSLGNNGLPKEFYETFWNELREIFVNSVLETKEKEHLSKSQIQAIIKLIERKKT